jgi:hypothetical protein
MLLVSVVGEVVRQNSNGGSSEVMKTAAVALLLVVAVGAVVGQCGEGQRRRE